MNYSIITGKAESLVEGNLFDLNRNPQTHTGKTNGVLQTIKNFSRSNKDVFMKGTEFKQKRKICKYNIIYKAQNVWK